ncbi:MAG: class I SAM-dependent methyltransferase family protein [Candidatus Woesearchaeota archaeon]|nr:class I SAM-dependent methyltransferase family protein [Candidatus Woesearchaeota archaeon]
MTALKELLKNKLTKKQLALLPSSFDVVGDILIFADLPSELSKKEKLIGETLLQLFKNINVICKKTKKYSGRYRTPTLKIIAGEKRKTTDHRESGCMFRLDAEKCYFSPRLSNERLRIAKQIKENEIILAMFSGVGPYPIVISKNSKPKEIYSIEINPIACEYQQENILLNKVKNIKLFKGDAKKIVPNLNKKFDRILMPLPKGAENFLELALSAAKKGTIIHFYDFLNENEFEKGIEKLDNVCKKLKRSCKIINIVKCGQYKPREFRVCVDFEILK